MWEAAAFSYHDTSIPVTESALRKDFNLTAPLSAAFFFFFQNNLPSIRRYPIIHFFATLKTFGLHKQYRNEVCFAILDGVFPTFLINK